MSNRLLHSRAVYGDARRNRDLEPDSKHAVHDGLHFKPARVSDHMRDGLTFAIGKIREVEEGRSAASLLSKDEARYHHGGTAESGRLWISTCPYAISRHQ